jgi:hypothetical protein
MANYEPAMKIFLARNRELTADAILIGLLDHGLFGEKPPPCFTSKGLAEMARNHFKNIFSQSNEEKLKKVLKKCSHDYIRYAALRDINIPRHLGIPHPESYSVQALAIKQHWDKLRAHYAKPKRRVSQVYVRPLSGGRIFEMNYKGSDRFELEENELQWMAGAQYIAKTDISACFPSIYTHSIPWALHGRNAAKKDHRLLTLYGNMLDQCTQHTRDSQTNGLLIGPHASNIISEIILTHIDDEMLKKRYTKLKRYIDDYEFYADSRDEAEQFLHDLGLALREYELTINEKKTRIFPLPRPSEENWVRELNRFVFPSGEDVKYSNIRSFLDLAIELSQLNSTSSPLNYAIKMMPRNLNQRARKMYLQEAINLVLAYPYLAPILDQHVFDQYPHEKLGVAVAGFAANLIRIGLKKIYPDAIAYALYYALKHETHLKLQESELLKALDLNDCLLSVLLLEYSKRHNLKLIQKEIQIRSDALKSDDSRARDRQWLLIYQTWSAKDLERNAQSFLSILKKSNFRFLQFPSRPHTPSKTKASSTKNSKSPRGANAK